MLAIKSHWIRALLALSLIAVAVIISQGISDVSHTTPARPPMGAGPLVGAGGNTYAGPPPNLKVPRQEVGPSNSAVAWAHCSSVGRSLRGSWRSSVHASRRLQLLLLLLLLLLLTPLLTPLLPLLPLTLLPQQLHQVQQRMATQPRYQRQQ